MENNQENLPPIIPPQSPKPLDKKLIIMLVLILVAIGIGYFTFNRQYVQKQIVSQTNNQEIKNGWEIYKNKVLGIEFTYPKSWGEPEISPEHLTDLNAFIQSSSQKDAKIFVTFEDKYGGPKVTLFNDNTLGLEEKDDYYKKVYLDDIFTLRNTGDICKYNFQSQKLSYFHRTFNETYNSCKDGVKVNVLEIIEDFRDSSFNPNPGILYSYNLNYFLYAKAGNGLFPHIVAEFTPKLISQKKSQVLPEDFLKDDSYLWNKKVVVSDFIEFAKSIKPISVERYIKTKIDILSSDTADIKIVKTYYNLLANNDYQTAFSYLINPSKTKENFILSQNDIYDRIIREVNQISNNTVEVFLDIQEHNQPPRKYRQVFEIINNKLQQNMEESINGEVSIFGNMKAYASERGLQSVVVLQENGQEIIVDSREHTSDADWWSMFYSPYFSPKGRYIKYTIGHYEGSSSDIYDILNKKVLNKSIPNGNFNQEETLYFSCQFSEAYGPVEASIYTVPQFSVKTDLLKLHPELSKYWNYKCSNDEKTHIETFEFSGSYENNSYSTATKEVYRFNSQTGESLP